MAFPIHISSIGFDSQAFCFTLGQQTRFIWDPFDIDNKFLGRRLVDESLFFPVAGLQCFDTANEAVLLFVARESNSLLAWKLSVKDGCYAYDGHFTLSSKELFDVVRGDDYLKRLMNCFYTSCLWAPNWVADRIFSLTDNYSSAISNCLDFRLRRIGGPLGAALLGSYTSRLKGSLNDLLDFVSSSLESHESTLIKKLFCSYCNRLKPPYSVWFVETAKYCALREFIFLVSGKHVTLDPFGSEHVFSSHSACAPQFNNVHDGPVNNSFPSSTRFIRYESSSGEKFIEVRGDGWLDVSSRIILDNGIYFEIQSGQQWNRAFRSIDQALIAHLFEDDIISSFRDSNGNKPFIVNIDCGNGANLGHVLWNEASGLVELASIFNECDWMPSLLRINKPPLIPSKFSHSCIRDFAEGYIVKTLEAMIESNPDSVILKKFATAYNLGINKDIATCHSSFSFRYPRMSIDLVSTIREDYDCNKSDSVFRITLNIRTHNKAHINQPDCISALLDFISNSSEESFKGLTFSLEFAEPDQEHALLLCSLIQSYGIKCDLHMNYDIKSLLDLAAQSHLFISPVGSGLVIPTWIWGLPTVVYGDRMHMKQIEWWPYVGGNELQIFQVANSAITDVSDEFYSDYTIDPSEYRSTVVKAIYSTRKILNTNFREVMADSLIDIAEQESENPAH